jgi:hypothetical protein
MTAHKQKRNAINAISPNAKFTLFGLTLNWLDENQKKPTEEEIQAKIQELKAAEPMRLLRIQRNQLLQETDWRMTTDYPNSDQAQWASYRTQLRNLPATSEPTLSESGKLIVDWPTAPDSL